MPNPEPSGLPLLLSRGARRAGTAMALGAMNLGAMVSTVMGLAPTAIAQSFRDTMINQRCTKAATDNFAKLAKAPPAGFIPFTCSCVVEEINAQVPVEMARASCKAQAIAKFGKP